MLNYKTYITSTTLIDFLLKTAQKRIGILQLMSFLEVTSIRSGLRKRKRPESPQSTDPQVSEEWVDEDKLELWEIKQYGER